MQNFQYNWSPKDFLEQDCPVPKLKDWYSETNANSVKA
jgi:hypothetical protein